MPAWSICPVRYCQVTFVPYAWHVWPVPYAPCEWCALWGGWEWKSIGPKIVGFPPKSSISIGFSIILTSHFGVPLIFGNTHIVVKIIHYELWIFTKNLGIKATFNVFNLFFRVIKSILFGFSKLWFSWFWGPCTCFSQQEHHHNWCYDLIYWVSLTDYHSLLLAYCLSIRNVYFCNNGNSCRDYADFSARPTWDPSGSCNTFQFQPWKGRLTCFYLEICTFKHRSQVL